MKVFGSTFGFSVLGEGLLGAQTPTFSPPQTGVSINGWVPHKPYSEILIAFWEPLKGSPDFWKHPFKNRRFRMSDAGAFLFRKALAPRSCVALPKTQALGRKRNATIVVTQDRL